MIAELALFKSKPRNIRGRGIPLALNGDVSTPYALRIYGPGSWDGVKTGRGGPQLEECSGWSAAGSYLSITGFPFYIVQLELDQSIASVTSKELSARDALLIVSSRR